MALSDIVPINRKEEFLQAIADKSGAPSPVTRIEEFLKRISESSGGSGLPEYTSADKGKVLTVVDAEPVETVVVPEQSGTISAITYDLEQTAYGAILDGVDTSSLANEQSVTFEMAIGPSSNTVTLYYLADANMFVTALGGTGVTVVYLAEVDGQNKWIFDLYDSSTVGLAYTVSATASVTPSTTTVIVPEQTVTTVEGDVDIPNIGTILSLDTDAIMTVNGTPLQATYNSSQQYWVATSGDYAYTMTLLTKGGERVLFSVWDTVNETRVDDTFTVMLSVSSIDYEPVAVWANTIILVSAEFDGVKALTLNKSYNEIISATLAVVVNSKGDKGLVLGCHEHLDNYAVVVNGAIAEKSENISFTSSSSTGVLSYVVPK